MNAASIYCSSRGLPPTRFTRGDNLAVNMSCDPPPPRSGERQMVWSFPLKPGPQPKPSRASLKKSAFPLSSQAVEGDRLELHTDNAPSVSSGDAPMMYIRGELLSVCNFRNPPPQERGKTECEKNEFSEASSYQHVGSSCDLCERSSLLQDSNRPLSKQTLLFSSSKAGRPSEMRLSGSVSCVDLGVPPNSSLAVWASEGPPSIPRGTNESVHNEFSVPLPGCTSDVDLKSPKGSETDVLPESSDHVCSPGDAGYRFESRSSLEKQGSNAFSNSCCALGSESARQGFLSSYASRFPAPPPIEETACYMIVKVVAMHLAKPQRAHPRVSDNAVEFNPVVSTNSKIQS